MLMGKRVVVVLPAYRAEKTLEATYIQLPHDVVDRTILIDDASPDRTVEMARSLGIKTFIHQENLGYGANQKTCYREALAEGADLVVMVHPDYQYDPRLVTAMAAMVASGIYDVVLGSRILGYKARQGGMPRYKYIANRLLTTFENWMLGSRFRNSTPATARSHAGRFWRCRSWLGPTTLSSTTRYSLKPWPWV